MDESLFKKVPVKVQKKSGFDLSFQNLLTTKVGTITPVLCEELIPNETVHLRAAIQAQLPPLASDTFMRCDLKYEAFFVPHRLIFKGFEEWLVPGSTYNSAVASNYKPVVPLVRLSLDEARAGSLADYLGFKSNIPANFSGTSVGNLTTASTADVNALPFLAYHKIYDDWYRNTLVQSPIYRTEEAVAGTASSWNVSNSLVFTPNIGVGYILTGGRGTASNTTGSKLFMDGVMVTDLRQRNFGIDRFTSATPQAQNGDEQGLKMTVSNSEAGFTIGQLRAANSIQQWLERNNLAGNRLTDYVKANYGANLSDGVAQRSLLLGSGQFAVYSKGIYQTAPSQYSDTDSFIDETRNPFAGVAASYGSAFASGNETIIDTFTANEPGYLFVMCTLVPKVTYATGVDRKLSRYITNSRTDMANPMLQNTGNEPIWRSELVAEKAFRDELRDGVFGYQERYADWKSKQDELHGLLRERNEAYYGSYSGSSDDKVIGSLSSFALQSSFSDVAQGITSNFLKIPTDYLDNVSSIDGEISKYGCWIDSYFDFRVSMPLARYSMPTLQDPAYEHGDDIVLDRGGKRL